MSQVFVMQPFEIIKVRLQTQPTNPKLYNGIIDCLFKIIREEGPLALYKGFIEFYERNFNAVDGSWNVGLNEVWGL